MAKRWTPEQIKLLRDLLAGGHSYRSAAQILGKSYNSVKARCQRAGYKSLVEPGSGRAPGPVIEAPPVIKPYDGALVLPGDLGGGLMIVGDVHSPCTDWLAATRAALIAQRYLEEPRRLIIAGDMMNWDTFSKYENLIPIPTLRQEIDAAKYALQMWLQTFDNIYLILGNHDYRWLKSLKGVFEEEHLMDLLKALLWNDERVVINVYSYLDVLCDATGLWSITHTPEFSKAPLSKARFLGHVTKDRHLVLFHQHGAAVGLDESARYMLVDGPALVDPDKLAYVNMNMGTKPRMKTGFVMLKGGYPYLFADGLTDWGYWLE